MTGAGIPGRRAAVRCRTFEVCGNIGAGAERRTTATKLIPFALSARLSQEFFRIQSLGDRP